MNEPRLRTACRPRYEIQHHVPGDILGRFIYRPRAVLVLQNCFRVGNKRTSHKVPRQKKMYRKLLAGLLVVCLLAMIVEARYLPTRSQDDRLLRLRQLLKDLLENDLDDMRPDHQMATGYDPRLFKRDTYDRDRPVFIH